MTVPDVQIDVKYRPTRRLAWRLKFCRVSRWRHTRQIIELSETEMLTLVKAITTAHPDIVTAAPSTRALSDLSSQELRLAAVALRDEAMRRMTPA